MGLRSSLLATGLAAMIACANAQTQQAHYEKRQDTLSRFHIYLTLGAQGTNGSNLAGNLDAGVGINIPVSASGQKGSLQIEAGAEREVITIDPYEREDKKIRPYGSAALLVRVNKKSAIGPILKLEGSRGDLVTNDFGQYGNIPSGILTAGGLKFDRELFDHCGAELYLLFTNKVVSQGHRFAGAIGGGITYTF